VVHSTAADLRRFLNRQIQDHIERKTLQRLGPGNVVTNGLIPANPFQAQSYWSDAAASFKSPMTWKSRRHHVPETFLRVLGPKPYRVAYVQPSRRPADGRYGENPNRLYKHQQLQVILKPSPADIIDQYLGSLEAVGIDLRKHDIKFEEDNWESPTLGAWGIGWPGDCSMEWRSPSSPISSSAAASISIWFPPKSTYGLERLVAFLQGKESVYRNRMDSRSHLRGCPPRR